MKKGNKLNIINVETELAVQIKKNNNRRNAMYAERTVATQQETPYQNK